MSVGGKVFGECDCCCGLDVAFPGRDEGWGDRLQDKGRGEEREAAKEAMERGSVGGGKCCACAEDVGMEEVGGLGRVRSRDIARNELRCRRSTVGRRYASYPSASAPLLRNPPVMNLVHNTCAASSLAIVVRLSPGLYQSGER